MAGTCVVLWPTKDSSLRLSIAWGVRRRINKDIGLSIFILDFEILGVVLDEVWKDGEEAGDSSDTRLVEERVWWYDEKLRDGEEGRTCED